VPTHAEQWAVRPGDVVDVMVWFASSNGPYPATRSVRIDSIEDDMLTASAIDADVVLQFRHDHVIRIRR
jgi:hypothetical protein